VVAAAAAAPAAKAATARAPAAPYHCVLGLHLLSGRPLSDWAKRNTFVFAHRYCVLGTAGCCSSLLFAYFCIVGDGSMLLLAGYQVPRGAVVVVIVG
jgi:hypothetical protein